MPGEALGVEQRLPEAVGFELLFQGDDLFRVSGELYRPFDKLFTVPRHQFGQADGRQQALRYSRSKASALFRQDRQAAPEQIRGRGMTVIGKVSSARSARPTRLR